MRLPCSFLRFPRDPQAVKSPRGPRFGWGLGSKRGRRDGGKKGEADSSAHRLGVSIERRRWGREAGIWNQMPGDGFFAMV
jgi:hypothetical protein